MTALTYFIVASVLVSVGFFLGYCVRDHATDTCKCESVPARRKKSYELKAEQMFRQEER